jgi:hypothetical protein
MIRSVVFSWRRGSRVENCHATAAAQDTSMMESSPKPITAVEDATVPAASAMLASIRL